MTDQPVTASAVISFTQRLESGSASFYEEMAMRFVEHQETFLGYAKASQKNRLLVTRTYQETVTDALETGYSFEGLRLDDYLADSTAPVGMTLDDALAKALALEEKAVAFYEEVAERSQSLLATIPRAFRRAAKKRRRP